MEKAGVADAASCIYLCSELAAPKRRIRFTWRTEISESFLRTGGDGLEIESRLHPHIFIGTHGFCEVLAVIPPRSHMNISSTLHCASLPVLTRLSMTDLGTLEALQRSDWILVLQTSGFHHIWFLPRYFLASSEMVRNSPSGQR
jgi:hypothetical protein